MLGRDRPEGGAACGLVLMRQHLSTSAVKLHLYPRSAQTILDQQNISNDLDYVQYLLQYYFLLSFYLPCLRMTMCTTQVC